MNRTPFDTTQGESDLLAQLTAASGRLDALMASVQQHTRDTQAALHTAREQEEARFRQAMVALFQEQQQPPRRRWCPPLAVPGRGPVHSCWQPCWCWAATGSC